MLFKLKKITADYYGVLSKLRRLRELADTLGEIGTDLRKDAKRAENQCKDWNILSKDRSRDPYDSYAP